LQNIPSLSRLAVAKSTAMVDPTRDQQETTLSKSFLASFAFGGAALAITRIDSEAEYRRTLLEHPEQTPESVRWGIDEGLGYATAIIFLFWVAHVLTLFITDRRWRRMGLAIRLVASGICGALIYLMLTRRLVPLPQMPDDPFAPLILRLVVPFAAVAIFTIMTFELARWMRSRLAPPARNSASAEQRGGRPDRRIEET